ncbi:unnamed protein product, partial [Prorocentrum cordatum]
IAPTLIVQLTSCKRARRALWGWGARAPGFSRIPEAFEMFVALCAGLPPELTENVRVAIFALLASPGADVRPGGVRALLAHWLSASAQDIVRRGMLVFRPDVGKMVQVAAARVDMPNVMLSLVQPCGASIDALNRALLLGETRERGRWQSANNVLRYKKRRRILERWQISPIMFRDYATVRAEHPRGHSNYPNTFFEFPTLPPIGAREAFSQEAAGSQGPRSSRADELFRLTSSTVPRKT